MKPELHLSVRFAILQMLAIVLGVSFTTVVLKAYGYPGRDLDWNMLPLMIRNYGFLLLVIPVIWTGWVIFMDRSSKHWWSRRWTIISAIILIVLLAFMFFGRRDESLWRSIADFCRIEPSGFTRIPNIPISSIPISISAR